MIRDRVPLDWRGRVHVSYRTVHGRQRTRGCESHTDAVQFCEAVDSIDALLKTVVTRDWHLVACRCTT